jgi:hypothetical protein
MKVTKLLQRCLELDQRRLNHAGTYISVHTWEAVDLTAQKLGSRNGVGGRGLDSFSTEQRPVESPIEHGNEPSGSMKCWECSQLI